MRENCNFSNQATDLRWLEEGRLLFARPWRFLTAASQPGHLPPGDGPEAAFAGRSNAGKSSLLNALTGQKDLARTSNTPGRTQTLNFFVNEASPLKLVDMPGYGYAKAPKGDIWAWRRLSAHYLRGRANLRRAYMLIDSRHGLKESDLAVLDVLDESALSYQIVMTKADKPGGEALKLVIGQTQKALSRRPAAHPHILVTSAAKNTGLERLRAEIAGLSGL